jgi:hypothetical protein
VQPAQLQRWWDGTAWTGHTQPAATFPAPQDVIGGVAPGPVPGAMGVPPQWSPNGAPVRRPVAAGNRISITCICIEVAYVLLAAFTGFFLIGILPLVLSIRAISTRERLGPVALVVTIAGFVLSLVLSAHHHHT